MDLDKKRLQEATDSQLVEWTRDGSVEAFEQLVFRYHPSLISFLRYFCVNRSDIEDVAQETFLKCYSHLEQFDTNRKFRNWLFTIARRTIPKRRSALVAETLSIEEVAGKAIDPHSMAEQVDQSDSIWKAVRVSTTDDEFQLMWFRYAEQLSHKEIAHLMQRSNAAVKMQLSRLRKRLRPQLKRFVFPESINANSQPASEFLDPKKKAA